MRKVFLCIFTCLLAIFVMSHNVSALNNQLLGDDWYLYRHTSGNPMCAMNSFDPQARRQSVDSPWNVFNGQYNYFSCADSNNSAISAQQGDIIVVELNTDYELSPYWYNTSARYLFSAFSESIQTIYYYTDGFNSSVEFGWIYNSEINGVNNVLFRIQSINFYRKNASPPSYENALNSIQNSLGNINNSINNLPSAQDNAEAVADEQEQRTQDEVDQSELDAQDSQDDVDQATASLLAVGGQVVGVITSTPASNCNIPMNFAHFNVGVVNVCSNVPAEVLNIVRGVSALVFVPIIVNYAIYLVNKLVYLYRSFQE